MLSVLDVFVQGDVQCMCRTLANIRSHSAYGLMYCLYRAMFSAGAEVWLMSDHTVLMV